MQCDWLTRVFNLKSNVMDNELEERIERKKKMIADFIKISERLKMKPKAREKRLDAMLEDLKKLTDQRK